MCQKQGEDWRKRSLFLLWLKLFSWLATGFGIGCGFGIGWGFGGKWTFCFLSHHCIAKCTSEIRQNCIWMVNWTFHYTSSVLIELRDCTAAMFAGAPLQTLGLGAGKLSPCQNPPLHSQPTTPFNVSLSFDLSSELLILLLRYARR
jgi:hypothetical protein